MTSALPSKLRISVLLVGLALAAGCGESADKMLASAKDYLAKNDPAAAVIQLKNALAKNPESGEVRFLLGRTLLDGGEAVAAEIELRKALDLRYPAEQVVPPLLRAFLAQGETKKVGDFANTPIASPEGLADLKTSVAQSFAMQGKFPEAHAALQEALAAKSDFAPALLGLARLKGNQDDRPGAHAIIDGILAKTPQNTTAQLFKGDLLRADGKLDEAVASYEKGIAINPRAVLAHAAVITIHLQQGKPELAAKQLAAMEKAEPTSPLTYYMQALTAFERRDYAAARAASQNHLKLQPENPQGLQLAGQIAYVSQSDVQAQELLRKALSKAPELDRARQTLVQSYLRSGQPAKAIEALQPVLSTPQTHPSWLTMAGNVYLQAGDVRRAQEFFQRAAEADPDNKQAQTALAMARLQGGQTTEAMADLSRIAAEDTDINADMALIAANIRMQQYDKAIKAIDQMEKKQPGNPLVHNLRGGTLLGKGDRAGARASFEKALTVNPGFFPAANALANLDLQDRKPGDARKRYESVIAKDPKNLQALLALADHQARFGAAPAEVAATIGKAIAAAPADLMPRLALISHFVRANDPKQALTAVQEAKTIGVDSPDLLDASGLVYQLNGDINQALAAYGKLASLQPTTAHPYLRMAEIQAGAKDKTGARNSLQKGLSQQANSIPLQRAMILLDIDEGRADAALSKARQLQRSQPEQAAGYVIEGDIHVIGKAWDQAVAAFRAGMKAAPATDLAQRLYIALSADGKMGEANAHADAWLKSQPNDTAFRLFLADAANQRKDYGAAIAQYRYLLARQPESPALLNNLAWSLGRMKDPKALSIAEQAYKLAPEQPAVMDTLGALLVEQGNQARGLELLGKATQMAPQTPAIRLNYARALIKAGKKPEAKTQLDELAKLGDRYPAQEEVANLLKGL